LLTDNQNELGKNNLRLYCNAIKTLYLGRKNMAKQAKVLNQNELRRVFDYVATRKHAARNRALIASSFYSGMRVCELASLRYKDVVDYDGEIRDQILLTANMTKGDSARYVLVNSRLRKELKQYIQIYKPIDTNAKFFYSQKVTSDGFTPNTLAQHFHFLYKRAGIIGASSHSGRRYFLSSLSAAGISSKVLMRLAGHKHLSTTEKYIEINETMLRNAVELI